MKKVFEKPVILSIIAVIVSLLSIIFDFNIKVLPFNSFMLLYIPISLITLLLIKENKNVLKYVSLFLIIIPSLLIFIMSISSITNGVLSGLIYDYREKIFLILICIYYILYIIPEIFLIYDLNLSKIIRVTKIIITIFSVLIALFIFTYLISSGVFITKSLLYPIMYLLLFLLYPFSLVSILENKIVY